MEKRSLDDIQAWRGPMRRGRTKYAPQPELLDVVPEYLTRQQAAGIAGTSTRTVDRWLRDPDVPLSAFRGGQSRRPVLVSREELRVLLTVRTAEEQDGERGGPQEHEGLRE